MAVINKTGITNGTTIQAEHVTRTIDALSGVSTDTILATGSFTGSLVGALTGTASFATQALSASYAANVPSTASYALTALSSSYALTASYALNAGGGTGVGFPFTGSAQVTGSMGITGSLRVGAAALNQYGLLVIGSTFMSGSSVGFVGVLDPNTNITANKTGIIDLSGLGGVGIYNGKFVLPNGQPAQPTAGTIYWDDENGRLYVYREATGTWIAIN
jgi:hypothetical protein